MTDRPLDGAWPLEMQSDAAARTGRRVLIYSINYAPEAIGVGRYSGEFGAYLASQGAEVEVVTAVPHYPGWQVRDGYSNWYSVERRAAERVSRCPILLHAKMRGIWRLLAPLSFAVFSAPVVVWRILITRPDAVLCVEPTLFAAPAALVAAKLIGARTVLHVQDLEIDAAFAVGHLAGGTLQKLAAWFERNVLSAFDAVVTISERMQERLAAKGVAGKRLSVVRNWVDLEKIKPLHRASIFRRELGIPDDTFVALYAGNIGRKQALPLMLEAAAGLVDHPNLLFVIAGDGPEKAALQDSYGHLPNVRFLPLQTEEKLCELLNLADVHVLPQHLGTADLVLPSKLGGMLASGKACIVMAEPDTELHQFLADTAVLTPAGDVNGLKSVLLALARNETPIDARDRLLLAERLRSEKNLSLLAALVLGTRMSEEVVA